MRKCRLIGHRNVVQQIDRGIYNGGLLIQSGERRLGIPALGAVPAKLGVIAAFDGDELDLCEAMVSF
jgi:hypothetical protein